jgi:hypothetical protein
LQKIICRKVPKANWTWWATTGNDCVRLPTRTVREDISGLPELSVSYAKQTVLVRAAQRFLADRYLPRLPDAL